VDFVDRVVALHDSLAGSGIPHAFGGALALAYHATPRGTVAIGLNVFLPTGDAAEVIEQLTALGIEPPPRGIDGALPTAGLRCPWDDTHVDLFSSFDTEFFASVRDRAEPHAFEDSWRRSFDLPFLSAEDLCVFKVTFDRQRDLGGHRGGARRGPLGPGLRRALAAAPPRGPNVAVRPAPEAPERRGRR
jgi:hypothetical protein